MIYRDFEITCEMPLWNYWGVDENGQPDWADYRGDGGSCDVDATTFEFRATERTGEEGELIEWGFKSFEECKAAIDQHITKATTFQSEAGN